MINEDRVVKISKFLSLVLRHKPETIGIVLDENGWTDVSILIEMANKTGIQLNREILKFLVETNNKKRFSFNDTHDKIRANQGHTVEVELGYQAMEPPAILFHGTAISSVAFIFKDGLHKRNRHHVHLSQNLETAFKVGQRHGKPTILEVAAGQMHKDGYQFFLSANDVWLTEYVPVKYLLPQKCYL